jgi:hypothetical protein
MLLSQANTVERREERCGGTTDIDDLQMRNFRPGDFANHEQQTLNVKKKGP